ncbi:MAG: carboxypeptidase-like regulatory domain-containing protein [Planctomycetes bacterium]|nr:carboxypeptidase-like regulatory domain-containing protein [Planctomycetota bacterium]
MRVLDAYDGSALAGSAWTFSDGERELDCTADESGVVVLPAGSWRVSDWQRTFAALSSEHFELAAGGTATLWAARGCTLSVRVLDEMRRPVEAANVEWWPDPGRVDVTCSFREPGASRRRTTDAEGRAEFQHVPAPWAGRVLVSCRGYRPSQQTLLHGGGDVATEVEVLLQSASSERRWSLRCVDEQGTALSEVSVTAELVRTDWPDAAPIFLGRSAVDGSLELDDWVVDAHAFEFDGGVYPCRWTLATGALRDGACTDVELPRALRGRLSVARGPQVDVLTCAVVARDEPAGSPRAVPRTTSFTLSRDPSGHFAAELPASREVELTCRDEAMHCANATLVVERAGWEHGLVFDTSSLEPLLLVPHGGRIASVTIFSESLAEPVVLTEFERNGDSVRLALPPLVYALQVRSTAGECVTLDRQPGTNEASVEVYFQTSGRVELALVDAAGKPVGDVRVLLRRRHAPQRVASVGGAWKQSTASALRAVPDAQGRVGVALPRGDWEVRIESLPWRESLATSLLALSPESIRVDEHTGTSVISVHVPRPRALGLRLRAAIGSTAPWRWTVRNLATGDWSVFQGERANFWASDAEAELELADEAGTILGRAHVPAGSAPWNGEVVL